MADVKNNENTEPWKDRSYHEYRGLLPMPSVLISGIFALLSYGEIEATGNPGFITGASALSTIVLVGGLYKMHDFNYRRKWEKCHPLNPEK